VFVRIPTFFDIAPNATNVTASQANKKSGSSRVETFSLNGIEIFHYWQFQRWVDIFYVHGHKNSEIILEYTGENAGCK
jgi:hypothetical protein